jgi:hypothetical protein
MSESAAREPISFYSPEYTARLIRQKAEEAGFPVALQGPLWERLCAGLKEQGLILAKVRPDDWALFAKTWATNTTERFDFTPRWRPEDAPQSD